MGQLKAGCGRKTIAVAVAAISLFAQSASAADAIQVHDYVMMSTALALISADVLTSMDIKNHRSLNDPRCPNCEEVGLLMSTFCGKHPSDLQFVAMGVFDASTSVALWYYLPERFRWIVPVSIIAIDSAVVYGNFKAGLTLRF